MARQHPFANKARADMEANGIVFNSDGTTSTRKFVEQQTQVQPDQPEQAQPEEVPQVDEKERLLQLQREELEALRAEKESWGKQAKSPVDTKSEREIQLEQELEELRNKVSTQTKAEQADDFRKMLDSQGFDSENLDDDALLEIRSLFVLPMANKVQNLEERLAQYENKFREPTPEEKTEKIKDATKRKIVEEIPDFPTIFQSKAFQKRLAEKDNRFPTATLGNALQIAYENGDHEFIVKEVKNFLSGGNAPNISDVADVGANKGVGTGVQQPKGGGKYTFTLDEATQMLRKRQRGDLTQQEYSNYRAELEAHRSSQNK